MFDSRNAAIIDICRSYELVEEPVLKNLLASSEELNRPVAGLLVDQGHVSREILVERVANFLGLGYSAAAPADISQEVVSVVSGDLARESSLWRRASPKQSCSLWTRSTKAWWTIFHSR